ncbi:MAG: phosphate acyltransferase PlsX [Prevotellaceae bacterium]|jgi:glycerol-3-phosphate acyltransferase PlsX|nr:phosphate acyltransferase PlsX [Prevotellaceae bacterium]
MKIGIDAMGGDFAPLNVVKGAIDAYHCLHKNTQLVLFGDEKSIIKICNENNFAASNFEIVNTTEVIGMDDHPAKAFSQKSNSSITVGFEYLAGKKIDSIASAGSTGAMMVGAVYTVKFIEGILRPCIASNVPLLNGKTSVIADVGLNVDCKPDNLLQYALLGSIYAKEILGYENPRIGLVNVGEEEEKGSLLTRAAYELMKVDGRFNFIGNVEGHELFTGEKADVIICDGFTGNIILKQAESNYRIAKKLNIKNDFFDRFNYELYGGTPVLGVNAPIIIGHGASTPLAIKNMILQAESVVRVDLTDKIKKSLNIKNNE